MSNKNTKIPKTWALFTETDGFGGQYNFITIVDKVKGREFVDQNNGWIGNVKFHLATADMDNNQGPDHVLWTLCTWPNIDIIFFKDGVYRQPPDLPVKKDWYDYPMNSY